MLNDVKGRMSGGDPAVHLAVLQQRNIELERRLGKLRELLKNLDDHMAQVQLKYDRLLTAQENQCMDMVNFDE